MNAQLHSSGYQTALRVRPGERIVAGREAVVNLDLLNQHEARAAVLSAPRCLSGLSFDELTGLAHKAHAISDHPSVVEDLHVHRWTPAMHEKATHIIAVWCATPEHRAAYGGSVQ